MNKKNTIKQTFKRKGSHNNLDNINFNLKNEILSFLPVLQVINELLRLNKKFIFAIKKKQNFKTLLEHYSDLIFHSYFRKQSITAVVEKFKNIGESELIANQMAEYLLIRKIRDYTEFKVTKGMVNEEQIFNIVINALKVNQNIKSIYFRNIPIEFDYTMMEKIRNCLLTNKSIEHLEISNCDIGLEPKNFEILYDLLVQSKTLKSLVIKSNKIDSGTDNVKLLMEGLIKNKSIETLDLSLNYFKKKSTAIIRKYLSKTSTLKELIYENNMKEIKDYSIKNILKGIISNKSLNTIKLGENFIGRLHPYIDLLGKALENCNSIVNLDLPDNPIRIKSSLSLKTFFTGLSNCENLQQLNVSKCKFGGKAGFAFYLSEALKSLKSLSYLDLSSNNFGNHDSDLEKIMQALKQNCKKLSVLKIKDNYLGQKGRSLNAFLDAIEVLENLTEVDLEENSLGKDVYAMERLGLILNKKQYLKKLNLANNKLGIDSSGNMKKLAIAIEANTTIIELNLGRNPFNKQNYSYFVEMLKKNRTIEILHINKIYVSESDRMRLLCSALSVNKTIREIHLDSFDSWSSRGPHLIYFYDFLKDNQIIETIHLGDSSIFPNNNYFTYFCNSLKHNKKLENFYLDIFKSNIINLDEIDELLKINKNIKKFVLKHSCSMLTSEFLQKLLALVQKYHAVDLGFDVYQIDEISDRVSSDPQILLD